MAVVRKVTLRKRLSGILGLLPATIMTALPRRWRGQCPERYRRNAAPGRRDADLEPRSVSVAPSARLPCSYSGGTALRAVTDTDTMLGSIMMDSTTMADSRQAPTPFQTPSPRRHQHLHAQQTEHHTGDAAQQLHRRDDHIAHAGSCRFREEHCCQQAHRTPMRDAPMCHKSRKHEGRCRTSARTPWRPTRCREEFQRADLSDGGQARQEHIDGNDSHAAYSRMPQRKKMAS